MEPGDSRHGTAAGYLAHHQAGQYACDDCRSAHTRYARERRRRRGDSRATLVPLDVLRRIQARSRDEWAVAVIQQILDAEVLPRDTDTA